MHVSWVESDIYAVGERFVKRLKTSEYSMTGRGPLFLVSVMVMRVGLKAGSGLLWSWFFCSFLLFLF
jgi:hypothetical protein